VTGLVVVGDALLDVDIMGPVHRLCPDAPAPVVDVERELVRAGGAGLAATLAATDGVETVLVTSLAPDADGERLRDRLSGHRLVRVVSSVLSGSTSVKTRVRGAGRSVARFDRGGGVAGPATEQMLAALREADAVLVADYGRGMAADPRLRAVLADLAGRVPVVWDPHPRGPDPVPGAWLVTPNRDEARVATGVAGTGPGWAVDAAARLRGAWRCRAVAITLGGRGALLHHGGAPMAIPAPEVPVLDPCGAGDRFAVTATTGLLRGSSLDEAVGDAVLAAANFLADGGVSALGRPAAPAATGDDAARVIERTRAAGGVVVAAGGCFDLLHTGHIRTLAAARALGDCLIVCLNSDHSVRRLKGPDRPINHQADRAEQLAALRCVDAVAVFDADTPIPLLRRLRPDLWVKGGDYSADDLPEARIVREWGGRAVAVPYHAGRSTTRLAAALAGTD
jgi:rfaE bifunctional protein nucleotidyltransferase chain/domain/rfaE bifunctional protein kinase chain/domain